MELILLSSGSTHKAHLSFIHLNEVAKNTPSSHAFVSLIEESVNCSFFKKDVINIIYIACILPWNIHLKLQYHTLAFLSCWFSVILVLITAMPLYHIKNIFSKML